MPRAPKKGHRRERDRNRVPNGTRQVKETGQKF